MRNPADVRIAERLAALGRPSVLGVKPTLERMRALLAAIGSPERGLPVIHVGGTSGKGSTATIIARILQEAGPSVGLHVKPHLVTVRERIQIAGEPIPADVLEPLIDEVEPAAREINPTWHELTVALALLAFKRANVRAAVVEVGLGGTWDSTNLVRPIVAVLTNVGLDHTDILGDTVEKIALDKAGIIKDGCVVVSGVDQPSVEAIVRTRASAEHAPLWLLGREIVVRDPVVDQRGARFDLELPGWNQPDLAIRLLGRHQVTNAALAAAAAWAFSRQTDHFVGRSALKRGLARARVPGRFEVISRRPLVILDGAHSPPKMAALRRALDELFPGRCTAAVAASLAGHDIRATWAEIVPRLDSAFATSVDTAADYGPGRALPAKDVAEILRSLGAHGVVEWYSEPLAALRQARWMCGPRGVVIVTGSLYLVGAIREFFAFRSSP